MKQSTKILLSSLGQTIVGTAIAAVAHQNNLPVLALIGLLFAVNGVVIGTIEAREAI